MIFTKSQNPHNTETLCTYKYFCCFIIGEQCCTFFLSEPICLEYILPNNFFYNTNAINVKKGDTPQKMYWCIMFYGRISNVSGGICPLMSEKLAHWSVPVRAEAGSALSQQED